MIHVLAYRALTHVGVVLIWIVVVCAALALGEVGGVPGMIAASIGAVVAFGLVVYIDWQLRVILWHQKNLLSEVLRELSEREARKEKEG